MMYLASKSPRRRDLLALLDVDFLLVEVDVSEQRAPGEPALDYVRRVACDKALAGLACVAHDQRAVVLGADTEVILDDEVFGKPRDAVDAAAMLRRLSGRTHSAVSALTLVSAVARSHVVCASEVSFAALDEDTIARYLDSGEWAGKAGAYGIQGRAQSFIAALSGSHSGVMGLPLFETAELLRTFGVPAIDVPRDDDRRTDAPPSHTSTAPLVVAS